MFICLCACVCQRGIKPWVNIERNKKYSYSNYSNSYKLPYPNIHNIHKAKNLNTRIKFTIEKNY